MATAQPRVCSIARTLDIVGEKWALLALREVFLGNHRFNDIARNTGAPRDRLAARLRALEAEPARIRFLDFGAAGVALVAPPLETLCRAYRALVRAAP